jgi:hypothetical protein
MRSIRMFALTGLIALERGSGLFRPQGDGSNGARRGGCPSVSPARYERIVYGRTPIRRRDVRTFPNRSGERSHPVFSHIFLEPSDPSQNVCGERLRSLSQQSNSQPSPRSGAWCHQGHCGSRLAKTRGGGSAPKREHASG